MLRFNMIYTSHCSLIWKSRFKWALKLKRPSLCMQIFHPKLSILYSITIWRSIFFKFSQADLACGDYLSWAPLRLPHASPDMVRCCGTGLRLPLLALPALPLLSAIRCIWRITVVAWYACWKTGWDILRQSFQTHFTFHRDFAKFFFNCSDTVPWMFLLLAALPDILKEKHNRRRLAIGSYVTRGVLRPADRWSVSLH